MNFQLLKNVVTGVMFVAMIMLFLNNARDDDDGEAVAKAPELSDSELCRYVIASSGSAEPADITMKMQGSQPYGHYNRSSDGQMFAYGCSVMQDYVMLSTLPEWELMKNTEYKYSYDGQQLSLEFWQHGEYIETDTFEVAAKE